MVRVSCCEPSYFERFLSARTKFRSILWIIFRTTTIILLGNLLSTGICPVLLAKIPVCAYYWEPTKFSIMFSPLVLTAPAEIQQESLSSSHSAFLKSELYSGKAKCYTYTLPLPSDCCLCNIHRIGFQQQWILFPVNYHIHFINGKFC